MDAVNSTRRWRFLRNQRSIEIVAIVETQICVYTWLYVYKDKATKREGTENNIAAGVPRWYKYLFPLPWKLVLARVEEKMFARSGDCRVRKTRGCNNIMPVSREAWGTRRGARRHWKHLYACVYTTTNNAHCVHRIRIFVQKKFTSPRESREVLLVHSRFTKQLTFVLTPSSGCPHISQQSLYLPTFFQSFFLTPLFH